MRLTVEQIRKVFGDIVAVDDATYTFRAGRIYGLVGENGAGKTTFVRMLAGQIPIDSGSMTLTIGSVTFTYPDLFQYVSAVPQVTHFVQEWDALRNIFLGSEVKQWGVIREDKQRAQITELETFLFQLPSGRPESWTPTESTRVAIFRALIRQPYILIVDEALAALEGDSRPPFRSFLRQYANKGNIVLIVSHDLDDVQRRCDTDGNPFYDEVLVFRRGAVRTCEPSESLYSLVFDSESTGPVVGNQVPSGSNSSSYLLQAEFQ